MTEEQKKKIEEKVPVEVKVELPKDDIKDPILKEEPKKSVVETGVSREKEFDLDSWKPKTAIGKKVKSGEITNIDQILDRGLRILEVEIVDYLLPDLQADLISVGQSKGKFGGGKRSIWRQTQKKTKEGNKPKFSSVAIVGSKQGYLGMGYGKAKETVPAREKAMRRAKLSIIKIRKGCGSWECGCGSPHSIPFKIDGKMGGIRMKLMPAPKGTGLCIEKECGKLLLLCGVTDLYTKTFGNTNTKLNLVKACFEALNSIARERVMPEYSQKSGMDTIQQ